MSASMHKALLITISLWNKLIYPIFTERNLRVFIKYILISYLLPETRPTKEKCNNSCPKGAHSPGEELKIE
jgi:hypothetical protein